MNFRKTQLAVAVGGALLAGATAVQAQSATVMSRDKDPVVTLYGQVGRALMWADDGHRNKWFHSDAESDGTRLGVRGSTPVMPGLRAGFRFEWEIQSNSTDKVNFDGPSHMETSHARERFQEVILQGAWGQLHIGQGEPGADNAVSRDLSGTKNGTAAGDFGGAIAWRNSAGATLAGAPSVGSTHSQLDFDSRYDRFMYTSPTFGGFWVQVSTGQTSAGEANELGLWYRGKLAGDIEAAIGYNKEYTGAAFPTALPHNETIGGSVSWLHTSGLNLTFGYATSELSVTAPGRDAEWTYGKVGYKFGPHALSVGYGITKDQAATGDEGDVMQFGYVWNPVRWFDLFALYQVFTLDRPSVQVEDVTVFSAGVAVRF